jgi:hypothetical protein
MYLFLMDEKWYLEFKKITKNVNVKCIHVVWA